MEKILDRRLPFSLPLRIGSRASPLALAQAREVVRRLGSAYPELQVARAVEIVAMSTKGDRSTGLLTEIGGKGLFTEEIEAALLARTIDLAVHSMKDLPTKLPAGLIITAVLEREDASDYLIIQPQLAGKIGNASGVSKGVGDATKHLSLLQRLPAGARVGTASLRRAAQVLALRPDLVIVPLRGNVGTRLRKITLENHAEATILACAGLNRLNLSLEGAVISESRDDKMPKDASNSNYTDMIYGERLSIVEMLPAVAQGAIAIEVREDYSSLREGLQAINHRPSEIATMAERAMLEVLDGSCRTPIGGLASWTMDDAASNSHIGSQTLQLIGMVASSDGKQLIRQMRHRLVQTPSMAQELGIELGQELKRRFG